MVTLFLYKKHFYKLHHNTCNKILLIFMHTLYCTYLHLQKGKISSEVWTKSDNHRDCVVLRPRSISLVIVRVCHVSYHLRETRREWERYRCVYIHIRENSLVVQVNGFTCHWSTSTQLTSTRLPSFTFSLSYYEEKDEWKYN